MKAVISNAVTVAVLVAPLLQGPQSGTMTSPALPFAAMCARRRRPRQFRKGQLPVQRRPDQGAFEQARGRVFDDLFGNLPA